VVFVKLLFFVVRMHPESVKGGLFFVCLLLAAKIYKKLEVLVGRKDLVNVVSNNAAKETALYLAARAGSVACVSLLCAAGANTFATNASGETAMTIAKKFEHEQVTAFLSKEKQDDTESVNKKNGVNGDVEAVAVAADRTADSVVVDRWGFLGGQVLNKDEELHKRKEVEREIKWVEMRSNWDRWERRKVKKLRERCLKGIPGTCEI
jgi:hypothetical protein